MLSLCDSLADDEMCLFEDDASSRVSVESNNPVCIFYLYLYVNNNYLSVMYYSPSPLS